MRVLAWRTVGAALALGSTILVTRLFGPDTAGRYFLAVALASIAITLTRLGLDLPTMRLVSVRRSSSQTRSQRSVLKVAAQLSGWVAVGLSLTLLSSAGFLAALFQEPPWDP